jgi:hypothetical protein
MPYFMSVGAEIRGKSTKALRGPQKGDSGSPLVPLSTKFFSASSRGLILVFERFPPGSSFTNTTLREREFTGQLLRPGNNDTSRQAGNFMKKLYASAP